MDTKYNLNMEFRDSASTILSSIPALTKLQVMSPGAPDVTYRLKGCMVSTSGATTMVKFDGKNYRKWAMYMEALSVQKNLWDIVSGTGFYERPKMCNTSSSMEERYKESSLARQLELKSENPDKWVQEWCDVLKVFLNMQTDKEDFWKVVMLNNFPEEYGAAITSLGSISDTPIRMIGTKLGERLWGLKGQNVAKGNSNETAYGVNNDKEKGNKDLLCVWQCWSPSEVTADATRRIIDGTITKMLVMQRLRSQKTKTIKDDQRKGVWRSPSAWHSLQVRVPSTSNTTSTTL
ncbi:hypothetical protein V1505DRAFT_395097 [Lipomyces doorenjongii]